MKKFYTFLMMLTVATLFTACNDRYHDDYWDADDAYMLEGTWTGYIESYFYDRFGKTGDQYRTTIYFERTNSYGGWGYEVDYNIYDRSGGYYCEFDWDVVDGVVRIQYDDSWNIVYLYPSALDDYRFTGRMDDGTSRDIYFDLRYDGNFDWGYWNRTMGFTRSAARGAKGTRHYATGEFADSTGIAKE